MPDQLTFLGNAGPPGQRWRECDFCLELGTDRAVVYHPTGKKALACRECRTNTENHKRCPICDDADRIAAHAHEDAAVSAAPAAKPSKPTSDPDEGA